jgi:hypothetical protein
MPIYKVKAQTVLRWTFNIEAGSLREAREEVDANFEEFCQRDFAEEDDDVTITETDSVPEDEYWYTVIHDEDEAE